MEKRASSGLGLVQARFNVQNGMLMLPPVKMVLWCFVIKGYWQLPKQDGFQSNCAELCAMLEGSAGSLGFIKVTRVAVWHIDGPS
jgi:hypothetical protein